MEVQEDGIVGAPSRCLLLCECMRGDAPRPEDRRETPSHVSELFLRGKCPGGVGRKFFLSEKRGAPEVRSHHKEQEGPQKKGSPEKLPHARCTAINGR